MIKISFYLRNYSSYILIVLVSCFIPNQSVGLETNITQMTGSGEGVIVFQTERHGPNEEIYIMNADGSFQTRLTFNDFPDVCPSISPDGTKIVFQSDRNGFYQLFTMNPDGSDQIVIPNSQSDYWPSWGIDSSQTGVNENQKSRFGFQLYQNYPNPFNPTTTVAYQMPGKSFVSLRVFDVLGKLVGVLVNEEKPVGSYETDFNTSGITSGIYFYQLKTQSYSETKKMILSK